MPASHRAANNSALRSITASALSTSGQIWQKKNALGFLLSFHSLALEKSFHCTAGLKGRQRKAVQERELGVLLASKSGAFTEDGEALKSAILRGDPEGLPSGPLCSALVEHTA